MRIARLSQAGAIELEDHSVWFPSTSFNLGGPTDEFLLQNGCMRWSDWKPYDLATHKMENCAPYVEDGVVYTVTVVPKTAEDFQRDAAQLALEQANRRIQAYRDESDPLFFKAQRGEVSLKDWIAKVEEIKARYPTLQLHNPE